MDVCEWNGCERGWTRPVWETNGWRMPFHSLSLSSLTTSYRLPACLREWRTKWDGREWNDRSPSFSSPASRLGACHVSLSRPFSILWTGQMGVWWGVFPFVQPHSPIYHLFILSVGSISRVSELMLDKTREMKETQHPNEVSGRLGRTQLSSHIRAWG